MVMVPFVFARDNVAEPVERALVGVVPAARDDVAKPVESTVVGVVPVARDDIAKLVESTIVGVVPSKRRTGYRCRHKCNQKEH
jgi:ribosomal protein L19E